MIALLAGVSAIIIIRQIMKKPDEPQLSARLLEASNSWNRRALFQTSEPLPKIAAWKAPANEYYTQEKKNG